MNSPQFARSLVTICESEDHSPGSEAFLGKFAHPSPRATRALIEGTVRLCPVFKMVGEDYQLVAIEFVYPRPTPANPDVSIETQP